MFTQTYNYIYSSQLDVGATAPMVEGMRPALYTRRGSTLAGRPYGLRVRVIFIFSALYYYYIIYIIVYNIYYLYLHYIDYLYYSV